MTSHFRGPCCIVGLLLAALPLAGQIAPPPSFGTAVTRLCGPPAGGEVAPEALLALDAPLAESARRTPLDRATVWHLACVRARLAAQGVIARPSYLMPLGTRWRHGASLLVARLLDDTLTTAPSELLALLNADPVLAEPTAWTLGYLERGIAAGVTAPFVLRQCSEFAWQLADTARARGCARAGLRTGVDSTYHLLTLARVAALASDTARAWTTFMAAAAAAHDSSDIAALGTQLRWFVTPAEDSTWRRLAPRSIAPWLSELLRVRDVRDGRAPGARLVEHFRRLAYVEKHFRLMVLPINRARLAHGAAHADAEGGEFTVYRTTPTSSTPADRFRQYTRWQTQFDDRGAVWMRFGEPEKRWFFASPEEKTFIHRETWRYLIDGQTLLLSFESEQGDGSDDATRLVTGVIGEHFCGIDPSRCVKAERAWFDNWLNKFNLRPRADQAGISLEEVVDLRHEDQVQIVAATTLDDNADRAEEHLGLSAQFLRLWQPATGAVIALVPWAIRAGDLTADTTGCLAPLELEVRSFDPVTGISRDSTVIGAVPLPQRRRDDSYVTGLTLVPATAGITAWSVVARQTVAGAAGRVFATATPPLGSGTLQLSDLVIGVAGQGISWAAASGPVTLAPLGTVSRREPMTLYYQVRSTLTSGEITTTVALYRLERGADLVPAFQVASSDRITRGVTEMRRELGLERLDRGRYRLEVRVADPAGRYRVARTTVLDLR